MSDLVCNERCCNPRCQAQEVHLLGMQSILASLSDIAFALNRVAHSVQQMEDTMADFRAMAAKEMGR